MPKRKEPELDRKDKTAKGHEVDATTAERHFNRLTKRPEAASKKEESER